MPTLRRTERRTTSKVRRVWFVNGTACGRNPMMDRTLLHIVVCLATVATATRIVQALATSIAYLVERFEGSGDDHWSGT
jgi:hypothetical protein